MKTIEIKDLGWDDFFESERIRLELDILQVARVTAERRGAYEVRGTHGKYRAKITGKHIFKAVSRESYPAVGDWVVISELDQEKAVILSLFPRKTVMKRKRNGQDEVQIIAANIDTALVIESVDRDYNLNRLERYCSIARDGGMHPVIVLNKTDLISKEALDSKMTEIGMRFKGIDIIATNALAQEGLAALKTYIKEGKTYCFLGSSGVGKSSLINNLTERNEIQTSEIGTHSGRGRHTTTAREMYFLENGSIVIDNPGMREVGMTDVNGGIDDFFDGITSLAKECTFADCSHVHEPGCAVLAALKSGILREAEYTNYIGLKKEADYYGMTHFGKREKDRRFGRFIKRAKKDLKNYKDKGYGE